MLSLEKARSLFLEQLVSYGIEGNPEQLYEPIRYTLSLGGKRIRPILALMTGSIYSDKHQALIPAAIALEIFHNFTLLHDDIMDNSMLRRNKPTVHSKWNASTAILSGDAMLIIAFKLIQKSDEKTLAGVMEIFTQTALEVCEGQQFDMLYEKQMDISEAGYLKMIELKTAVLMAASMKIGAIIAGAPQKDADFLYEAGKNLGMAFQLKDDLLDCFGTTSKFGKRIGGDIIENKKTYLYIRARDEAKPDEREELLKLYSSGSVNEEKKIQAVSNLFKKTDVQKLTEEKISHYILEASSTCERLTSSSDTKKELVNLFDYLIRREN